MSGIGKWNFLRMDSELVRMKKPRLSKHQILDILKLFS